MAVDANVLIFERIKEELGTNGDIQKAISSGYDKAVLELNDIGTDLLDYFIVCMCSREQLL
jgi:hypothetical protein